MTSCRRSLLEAGIAKFKLPERLGLVEEFPMSQVGKVSKRELRELVVASQAGSGGDEPHSAEIVKIDPWFGE